MLFCFKINLILKLISLFGVDAIELIDERYANFNKMIILYLVIKFYSNQPTRA